MSTTEASSASLGPRYAAEDPSLPKPWKGLIDGSTELLYYWNPETNITQYERPASVGVAPPLSSSQPPSVSVPQISAVPMTQTVQSSGMMVQQVHQMAYTQQQQGQQVPNDLQQQTHYMSQQQGMPIAQQGPQLGQAQGMQQDAQMMQQQIRQQMAHQPQPAQHQTQQAPQHQFLNQQPQQMMYQQSLYGQQLPQSQPQHTANQQGQQYPPQQRQQFPPQQGQQFSSQQGQQFSSQQGQQFPSQQGQHSGYPVREQAEFQHQQGNQIGFSGSQPQQGGSSLHNPQADSHSTHTPNMSYHAINQHQFSGSSVNVPQSNSSRAQAQQTGTDSVHWQQMGGPMVHNQMGQPNLHNQQPSGNLIGMKMGYGEDPRGRDGNGSYFNADKEGSMMVSQQPKIASIPMTRNQQDPRISQNVAPIRAGGSNNGVGPAVSHMYNHAGGGNAFPNNTPTRPPPNMLGMTDATNLSPVDAYLRQHEVTASGDNVPAPFMSFEATGFPPEILREIHLAGFSSPTPIQAQTWPIAMQSRDIVAIAKTGSGKTLGYLMPAFMHLRRCRNGTQNGPTVLVLAPTRELATQIQDEAVKFGRSSRVKCTCLYGGAPKGPQLRDLEHGVDIVVATPGRLNDILEMKKIDFRQISLLVLDEADRMLDMGFEPQIHKILNEIPPRRQTLMYTATWPKEVKRIAGDLLVNPVQVNIGNVDELAANKAITQYVEVVPQMNKQRRLEQILRSQERGSRVIIFCATKRTCDQLARSIGRSFGAAAIHGDKSQGKEIIITIWYFPGWWLTMTFLRGGEDYVHRIGRTGRAGATGLAYTFFCDQDRKYAADLVKLLEEPTNKCHQNFGNARPGMNRWDSGGAGGGGGGRFDYGGRGGMRDGGFGGRGGGMRDGGFNGRGGMRDGGFSSHGGGRNEFFGGRGNRGGRGFSGPGGGRNDRGHDRYDNMDGRGRFNNRRGISDGRSRGRSYSRSYSPSPDRVRTWDYSSRRKSQSRSRTRSRSRSRSKSRSRGRNRSRSSRSRSRSRSWTRSRSRSRSRSRNRNPDRVEKSNGENTKRETLGPDNETPALEEPMSPGAQGESLSLPVSMPEAIEPTAAEILPTAKTDNVDLDNVENMAADGENSNNFDSMAADLPVAESDNFDPTAADILPVAESNNVEATGADLLPVTENDTVEPMAADLPPVAESDNVSG
ncbi:hypothetical protein MKW92_047542 [Papaver armeniacum]|nr:hypothetical protein MKW92_047542 [Papaver armeniacum]